MRRPVPPLRVRPSCQRGGFTLIELLVATGVFIIGFVAVYALFLSGMRFRKLSDDLFKTATLASTLMTEVYIDSGHGDGQGNGPAAPSSYDGPGDPRYTEHLSLAPANAQATPPQVPAVPLYGYQGCPGAVYRLTGTTDILGGSDRNTTALVTTVLAMCPGSLPPPDPAHLTNQVADEEGLERFMHLMVNDARYATLSAQSDETAYYQNTLVSRGIAMAYPAVIIRQPHWLSP